MGKWRTKEYSITTQKLRTIDVANSLVKFEQELKTYSMGEERLQIKRKNKMEESKKDAECTIYCICRLVWQQQQQQKVDINNNNCTQTLQMCDESNHTSVKSMVLLEGHLPL